MLADIHDDKVPGNDMYTSYFIKVAWDIVGSDFVKAINNFFQSGRILRKSIQHV